MARKTKAERAEALESLRKYMPEGTIVYTILRRVSASGMSRCISLVVLQAESRVGTDGGAWMAHPNYSASVVLREPLVRVHGADAIRVGGCGMDMGFHLVDSLSYAIHGRSGALRQQWI